jgi:hypothetical protein
VLTTSSHCDNIRTSSKSQGGKQNVEYAGLELIEENDNGDKLYKLQNDLFDTVVLVCGEEEFALTDWQSNDQPESLEEAITYDWLPLVDIFEWHAA